MISHILLWNYKPEVTAAERAEIESLLVDLPTLVPTLRQLTFGGVFRWRVREYSHVATMVFEDEEGLDLYQSHAAHKEFAARFHPATTELVAIDYSW